MNLDELKSAWSAYDQKLQSTQTLNEKIVKSMIRDRSGSRISWIKRKYTFGFVLIPFWLLLGVAVLLGNPFDYAYTFQFIPIGLQMFFMAILLLLMVKAYRNLQHVNLNEGSLEQSLIKLISLQEKPDKFLQWTVLLLFASGLSFPLSFLPTKIEKVGISAAIIDTLIPMAITGLLYLIAYKTGAFKDKSGEKFREDLNELRELQQ